MSEKIIEVKGLKKSYGEVHAVRGLDFYVERGKLFAFLGPNGAGKSTTIDMICTFLQPDAGEVQIDSFELGKDDTKIRNIIGAVFQDGLLDPLLTVEENLQIRGSFYGLKGAKLKSAVKNAAEVTEITSILKRPYGKLSGGQRRRSDIARALIHTPRILFLDEPTTGLDPQTRKKVWETILSIQRKSNMTVFLTTHYMEEAARADYVIVIDHGEIAATGTPAQLKERYTKDRLLLVTEQQDRVAAVLTKFKYTYEVFADQLVVPLETTMEALPLLDAVQPFITSFEVIRGSMDDVFIAITGKEIRE